MGDVAAGAILLLGCSQWLARVSLHNGAGVVGDE